MCQLYFTKAEKSNSNHLLFFYFNIYQLDLGYS